MAKRTSKTPTSEGQAFVVRMDKATYSTLKTTAAATASSMNVLVNDAVKSYLSSPPVANVTMAYVQNQAATLQSTIAGLSRKAGDDADDQGEAEVDEEEDGSEEEGRGIYFP